ncbi:MAG: hypothetical protein NWE94_05990 [Candidatus Bathyarchaeota archaeon]|nr:hypothetical protein [Candidatus Bathyarchaeota archaeon]
MLDRAFSVPFDAPLAPNKPATYASYRRIAKPLYVAAAVIAVVAVAVAFLVQQGAAIIPLSVEYTVGEKMIYHTTETIEYQPSNATTTDLPPFAPDLSKINVSATTIVEVTDFDNETYTLNHTSNLDTGTQLITASFVEKLNKTGYSTRIAVQGPVLPSNTTSSTVITGLLERPEVKVGETWEIPLSSTSPNVTITGAMTLTFAGIENITVPAGTYQVYRIDAASSNVTITINPQPNTNTTISTIISSKGQMYIEYGTGRRIATTTQSTVYNEAIGLNYTLTANTTLIEHIKPTSSGSTIAAMLFLL